MFATADKLVEDYLDDLEHELADVPRAQRRELVAEIADHIAEGRTELPDEGEAAIRTLLDRIGEPAEIAGEARERFGVPAPQRRGGALEIFALLLLLPGSLVLPLVGWIAGVVLLWVSNVWTTRDKLIGTLVIPGGLLGLLVAGLSAGPGSALDNVLVLGLLIAPIASTGYLAWRLKQARTTG